MTPRQRTLARHALGLPNSLMRSYRNRFVAAYSWRGDFDQWAEMTLQGYAEMARAKTPSGMYRFWLTPKGAAKALDPGETLCPEDFPMKETG
ncbi:MAG: hypothetical protein AAGI03_15570 [Pseudomonadota bacterium]